MLRPLTLGTTTAVLLPRQTQELCSSILKGRQSIYIAGQQVPRDFDLSWSGMLKQEQRAFGDNKPLYKLFEE